MFLRRLEIQGFKSFPEKIRLDFKSGITGIVGPNGSGKSNISDAIRWVLGEQNPRALRGDKMEDLIFSGTKSRGPIGFAEVTMHLDNEDKKINLEYSEVSITRKVYRSGESGYFINGVSCRLRDIHELFMDTGIGKEGYSIIGQGKIDTILSSKSEDRRALFEEAVGIIKFKTRKIQAENKLQEVRKNLVRTNDIIAEIEKQIIPLNEQKEKAKQFLALSDKLKNVKVNLFRLQYENSENKILNIEKNLKSLDEHIFAIQKEKNMFIKKEENLKNKLDEQENNIQNKNTFISNIIIEIEQKQNNIKLDNERINFINENIKDIQKRQTLNENLIQKKNEEINLLNILLKGKKLEYEAKNIQFNNIKEKLDEVSFKMDKDEKHLKNISSEIMDKMNYYNILSNEYTSYKTSKEALNEKIENLKKDILLSKSKIKEKDIRNKVLSKKSEELKNQEASFENFIQEKNKELESIKSNLFILNQKKDDEMKKVEELKNKYKILKELEDDYEGYFKSVKAILKEKSKNEKLKGVVNVLGALISVPKKYDVAIEIALGGHIQNIVTNTEEDAKNAINYLKEVKKGRATFLPISSIKPKHFKKENKKALNEKGVLGVAFDIIQCEKQYENIFSNILGRIVVVDNIDNAINLSKKYENAFKIVTLEGEFINKEGALTGGSSSKKIGGIFSRTREIEEINQNINILDESLKKQTYCINEVKNKLSLLDDEIYKTKNKLNEVSLNKIKILEEIKQNENYIKDIEFELNINEKTLVEIQDEIEKKQKKNENIKNDIKTVESEIKQLKNFISDFENKIQKDKSFKEEILLEFNKLKADIREIEYQKQNAIKDIERLKIEITNINDNIKSLSTNIEGSSITKSKIFDNISFIESEIKTLKQKKDISIDEVNNLKYEKNKILQQKNDVSKSILNINNNLVNVENEKLKLALKRENEQEKIDILCDNIWQDYNVTYASACNEFLHIDLTFEEIKEQELKLKQKISKLGSVNLSAIEQYDAIKERYDLNIRQRDDILKADEDLKNIIARLIEEMENQFKNQFELINKNFNEVFCEIFGGGKAELILSDENNILTSGIEIVVQPTGKNLQNLSLLSGGERTLTAMSLLFAILRLKPSPFCILDETEASLDDANVIRYANFLKKFSKDNQFILITHKTGTMEIADTLYGVTMEEQGVSKVISVELKEAKEYEKL